MNAIYKINVQQFIIKTLLYFNLLLEALKINHIGGNSVNFYFLYLVMLFIISTHYLFSKAVKIRHKKIDNIYIALIFTWGYGLLMGFINGNASNLIIGNFAGMSIYTFYYIILRSKISKEDLFKMLLNMGHISLVILIISLSISKNLSRVGETRLVFSSLQYFSLMLLPIYLFSISINQKINFVNIFHVKKTLTKLIIILLIVFSIIASLSKGFILAVILIFVFFGIIQISSLKIYNVIVLTSLIIILVFLFKGSSSIDLAKNVFTREDISNRSRYMQTTALMKEFSIIGNGLGSGLKSGYYRDEVLIYAYEVTYQNILHKFGIISVVIFFSYYVVLHLTSKYIKKRRDVMYSAMAFGCIIGFMAVGIGNPVLFAPSSVLLHVFALYLVR